MSIRDNENIQKLLKQESYSIDSQPMGQNENGDFLVKTNIKTYKDGGKLIELVNKTVKENVMVIVKDVTAFAKGTDEVEATNNSILEASALLGL